jgi:Do/DeqQ family serine protease
VTHGGRFSLVLPVVAVMFGGTAPLACKRLPAGASSGVAALPSGALPVTPTALQTTSPLPAPLPGARAPQSFADLAAKADPAVVFVKTLQERRGLSGRRRVIGEGVGTAFVYDPNGLIITNNHVIDEASEIHVIFGRKREVSATVVGRDPRTDIAVLRVEEKNLPFLPLGDSDALRVGDWVVAIGNPFGLNHTVTAGIVSALGRTGLHPHGYEDFIQTDASINPGNSGGALVNLNGELIGINSAILSKDGGNIGIGFAIPVNMVKAVMDQLITYGEVKRGIVGIKLRDLTPEAAKSLQLVNARGAEISEVAPGSAADHAGIKVGDVAVSMNGVPVESAAQLRNGLGLLRVGQGVEMRVLRNGAERSVTLTINSPSSLNGP